MDEKLKMDFFEAFNNLKSKGFSGDYLDSELFKLTNDFRNVTGGHISQYNSPLPVGIAVVQVKQDDQIGLLACKRAIQPCLGGVAFPGGYVDEHENTKEATIRELSEETGLKLFDEEKWIHIGEKKTSHNQILFFYVYQDILEWKTVEISFKQMQDTSETQEVLFLREQDTMCFPLHSVIRDEQFALWKKKQ